MPLPPVKRSLVASVLLVLLGGLAAGSADANEFGFGGWYRVPVTSVRGAKFRTVVKQQYDFSCGSAALATLLSYHYEMPVGEREVFEAMFEAGDRQKIETRGFSLLDMKRYLAGYNFVADGYRAPLDKLVEVGIPAIVLINTKGYAHFVVIKGVTAEEVLVGDPALGLKKYARAEFERIWNGILFVITERTEVAQEKFNVRRDWRVRPQAPLDAALIRDSSGAAALMRPGRNDF